MNCLRVVVWKAERVRYTFTIHIYKCVFFAIRNVFLTPVMLCTYVEHKHHLKVGNTARFTFFPVSCWLTAILNVLKISLLFWSFYMLVLWCESTWRNVGFVNIRQEYIEFLCCNKCVRLITVMLLLSFCVVHLCFCLLCVFLLSLLAVIVHTCVLLRLLHPCVFTLRPHLPSVSHHQLLVSRSHL